MRNWYVFFVQTKKEQLVCNLLTRVLGGDDCTPFYLRAELTYKNSKETYKVIKPIFPGYIFVETQMTPFEFTKKYWQINSIDCRIYKLLGKENPECMAICEKERAFLSGLCDDQYIVRESRGFIIGDKVFITSGPFRGRESIIKRIDRHKRRAEVELEFIGNVKRVSLPLEIVIKFKDKSIYQTK